MLRRSHKKSRRGCVQCKKRHVKCDETRPSCRLCISSGQECSFASRLATSSTSHSSQCEQAAIASKQSHGQNVIESISTGSSHSVSQSPGQADANITVAQAVDLSHMELLIHITSDEDMFRLGRTNEPYHSSISFALQTGLKSPFLLYQLLAFSARHLAFLRPTRASFYLDQAINLQTEAISLFNASITSNPVDDTNCAAVLLFSSVLGHHVLADTFCKRDAGGLDAFLSHFLHCIDLHRGVHTVATGAWPLLMKTELQSMLTNSASFTNRQPRGSDCADLVVHIQSTTNLTAEAKKTCQDAVDYLQVGFDAIADKEVDENVNRHPMLCSWPMLLSPEFKRLLAAKTPEALVILAYYAVLLHHGRLLWQVGDVGVYLFDIIQSHLGAEWEHWTRYPREQIHEHANRRLHS